jgi:hypothetical protein
MGVAELGAIGEFVSSIAVLTTLIFLTLEMRRNSRLLIRSNARITASDSAKSLSELLDKEVAEIVRLGCIDGMSVLDPPERYRFDLPFCVWLYPLEQAFADFRLGVYPADHLVGYENAISGFLGTKGGLEWWEGRKMWFGPEFRLEIDALLDSVSADGQRAGPVPSTTVK